MTTIDQTAFARLDAEERLLNPVLKQETRTPGRFGFRGVVAIKLAPTLANEKRPPEIAAEQVLAVANAGETTIPFFAAYLLSFEYLKPLVELLGDALDPKGKYFLYCDNLDLRAKYQVSYAGATFTCLPIDEATVYNELLELIGLEKGDLKKLDTAGKQDAIVEAAAAFTADDDFEAISYEEGLKRMGPVRNRNENRPV